jgi:hypothetical protein
MSMGDVRLMGTFVPEWESIMKLRCASFFTVAGAALLVLLTARASLAVPGVPIPGLTQYRTIAVVADENTGIVTVTKTNPLNQALPPLVVLTNPLAGNVWSLGGDFVGAGDILYSEPPSLSLISDQFRILNAAGGGDDFFGTYSDFDPNEPTQPFPGFFENLPVPNDSIPRTVPVFENTLYTATLIDQQTGLPFTGNWTFVSDIDVPEPGCLSLAGLGLMVLALRRGKRYSTATN